MRAELGPRQHLCDAACFQANGAGNTYWHSADCFQRSRQSDHFRLSSATGYSAAPAPQITVVDNPTIASGSTGVSLRVVGFGFLPSSVVHVNGKPQQTTYNSSTFLTAALDSSAIPASGYGEIPVTVVTPAPGGGQSDSYTITIYQRIFTQNAGMLYEPTRKKLYISVPASATSHANTILPIDPATATLGTPIPVGTDPGVLAASADGQYHRLDSTARMRSSASS